jgi:hypothetical protein
MARSFACGVQVALMGVVGSAVAAMDANRGVAGVARCGLDFLRILTDDEDDVDDKVVRGNVVRDWHETGW